MNRIVTMLITAGVFAGSLIFAQESGRRNRGQDRGTRAPMQMSVEDAQKWSDVQTQLKKKYPDRFAEIEKLAQTNIAQAMQKMTQLAREAKIAIPQRGRGPRGAGFGGRGPRGEGFGGGRGPRGEGFGPRGEGFGGGRGPRGGFGGGNMRGGFGMMGNQRAEAEKQIKEKFPKEYDEIVKAREQAEEKLQALAQKADVKLPLTQEAMMKKMAGIRTKYQAEFEEIRKMRQSDPQGAMERSAEIFRREGIEMPRMGRFNAPDGDRNGPPQARRGNARQDMQKKIALIRKAYPEEMKKLDELRKEDPGKFREELRKLSRRYDRENPSGK